MDSVNQIELNTNTEQVEACSSDTEAVNLNSNSEESDAGAAGETEYSNCSSPNKKGMIL